MEICGEIIKQLEFIKMQTGRYPSSIVLGEGSYKVFKKEPEFKVLVSILNDLGIEIKCTEYPY